MTTKFNTLGITTIGTDGYLRFCKEYKELRRYFSALQDLSKILEADEKAMEIDLVCSLGVGAIKEFLIEGVKPKEPVEFRMWFKHWGEPLTWSYTF